MCVSSKSLYVVNKLSDADEFDRALDHIESRMKTEVGPVAVERREAGQREIVMTPEELRQIVSTAVTDAIAAYERARNAKAESARPAPSAPLRFTPTITRLQNEMGLNDIDFEPVEPAPVAVVELSEEAKKFVYQDPTEAALTAWDEALKRLSEG